MQDTAVKPSREKSPSLKASAPLARMADIIDVVAAASPDGLMMNRISDVLNLPMSTTHRFMKNLLAIGYLRFNEPTKTYHLGKRLIRTLNSSMGAQNLQTLAMPILQRLVQRFGQVFCLAHLVAGEARVVAYAIPNDISRSLVVPGETSPGHASALGKAILAYQDQATIEAILARPLEKFQPATMTDPDDVRVELELTRARGYALTRSEYEIGVTAVAVPIDIPDAGVQFAIGAAGFETIMFTEFSLEDHVSALRAAAEDLGGRQLSFH